MKNEQQAMVDRLKTITMPLNMLRDMDVELYRELHESKYREFWQRWSDLEKGWVKEMTLRPSIFVYRLSPDFQLPVKRWWYNNNTQSLHENIISVFKGDIEVSPDDLAYVRSVIERKDIDLKEWEYRKLTKDGGEWITDCGYVTKSAEPADFVIGKFRFVREPKPEAVAVQKEFEVYESGPNKTLCVSNFPDVSRPDRPLSQAWHYAIDRGMGMEFMFEKIDKWYVEPSGVFINGTPAKCIRVWCWVTEDGE